MPSHAFIRYTELLSRFSWYLYVHEVQYDKNILLYTNWDVLRYNYVPFLDIIQIQEFWKKLAWPDLPGSYNFVLKVVDVSDYRNCYSCRFILPFMTTLTWKTSTNLFEQLRVFISNYLNVNTCYKNSEYLQLSVVRHIIIHLRINMTFDIQ